MNRAILHIDMDAFFASVEQRDNPALRGRPVIVGAAPDKRGVVATCSYEARRFGIRSAMPSCEAFRRCPDAVFVRPDMRRYQAASERVFAIFERYSPQIEPVSIDEAFLDVSGVRRLHGPPQTIAAAIRRDIRGEVGLTASVGIACNKFLAKIASERAKPDGLFAMPDDDAETVALLGAMDVGELWGVGRVGRKILEAAGYHRVADIQRGDPRKLAGAVGGRFAQHLLNLAFGRDDRDVESGVAEQSLSREFTFNEDVSDRVRLCGVLHNLCDEVGTRLRAEGYKAHVCRLKIRWSDFRTITRQQHFLTALCDDFSIRELATELFNRETLIAPVRLLGVGVTGLVRNIEQQMLLFDEGQQRIQQREAVSRTVDLIRGRLGSDAIMRGSRIPESEGES